MASLTPSPRWLCVERSAFAAKIGRQPVIGRLPHPCDLLPHESGWSDRLHRPSAWRHCDPPPSRRGSQAHPRRPALPQRYRPSRGLVSTRLPWREHGLERPHGKEGCRVLVPPRAADTARRVPRAPRRSPAHAHHPRRPRLRHPQPCSAMCSGRMMTGRTTTSSRAARARSRCP